MGAFERALEKAGAVLRGEPLVRLELAQQTAIVRTKPAEVVQPVAPATGSGWLVPDAKDRWLFRSGQIGVDPEQVLSFIRLAEMGEVRFLFAMYEEMFARDAHIRAEVGKRSSYVLSARRDILPMPAVYRKPGYKDAPEAATAQECARIVEEQVYAPGVDFEGALSWLLSADLFGIAVLEVVTAADGPNGEERLVALKRVAPQRLRVVQNGTAWEVRGEGDKWYPLALLQQLGAAIVLEYEPQLVSPARRGLFRTILPLWLMRLEGPIWWGRAVELFGMPFRVATSTGGGTAPKEDIALEFEDQGAAAAFALPPGTDIKLLEAIRGELPHERFLEWAAKEISKAIHHSTQHADIQKGSGSVASAESQVEVMIVAAQEAANRAACAMTEQLFAGLIARRLGPEIARLFTPELRIRLRGAKSADDMLKGAQAIDLMLKNGLPLGISFGYDFMDAPAPDEAETLMEPQAPAPPPNVLPFPNGGTPADAEDPAEEGKDTVEASRGGRRPRAAKAATRELDDLERQAARDAFDGGRELLRPYVSLIDEATKEGWPLPQLLSRILHRFYAQPGATSAELRDTLAAAIVEAGARGIDEVRRSRGTA